MTKLCGKGIWLAHSYDLQRATEMATQIEANYLMLKVGHGPFYFPESTRMMIQRIRTLGFQAIGWVQITDYEPQAAVKAIGKALTLGYEATVLFLDERLVTGSQLQPLAAVLDNVEMPRERLYLASPPLDHLPDPQVVDVLAPLCQGGWMPLCWASWGERASALIDRGVYQAVGDLSLKWGKTPDIHPVLSPRGERRDEMLLPEDLIPWVEGMMRHGVDFFSVYHAANTEKALWPMLASVNIACMETAEVTPGAEMDDLDEQSPIPQPVYITVTTSDSVWGIIARHGMTKEQFWAWNAHLWESRGLPRDSDYLQEGWRVRVK